MNPLHVNMLVGGVGGGRTVETGQGEACWWMGESRSSLRQTTIPTHGGASRTDFVKVSSGQGRAGEVHPLGTGGTL